MHQKPLCHSGPQGWPRGQPHLCALDSAVERPAPRVASGRGTPSEVSPPSLMGFCTFASTLCSWRNETEDGGFDAGMAGEKSAAPPG